MGRGLVVAIGMLGVGMTRFQKLRRVLATGGMICLTGLTSPATALQPITRANGLTGFVSIGSDFPELESPITTLFTNVATIREVTAPPDRDGIIVTGVGTDLAIRGAGWFALRIPDMDVIVYTRSGDFRLDSNGYLITGRGYRVQGFSEPGTSAIGDLQIDGRFIPVTSDPAATPSSFTIDRDGVIKIQLSDGTEFRRGQILLQDFAAPAELERVDYQLFASTPTALPANSLAVPGSGNLGRVEMNSLDVTPLRPQLTSLANADDRDPLLRGAMVRVLRGTDLAIRGAGAFLVRDPVTSELFATRAGMFLVDSNNYLITYDRKRLQGRLQELGGGIGDVQVSGLGSPMTSPDAFVTTFLIARDGRVSVSFSDGTQVGWDHIALYDFEHPEKLCSVGLGQFSGVLAAQPSQLQNVGAFGSTNNWIQAAALELVNVTPDLLARRRHLNYFSQGALTRTDSPSDLAVDGEGFFLLKNPQNGQLYVTRRGDFRVDEAGYLVSARGLRLQGYVTPYPLEIGDLQIDLQFVPATTDPDATIVNFVISRDGSINIMMSDGTSFQRGQVLLQSFREPFVLRAVGGGLYGNLTAAVPKALAPPGTYGLGEIQSSALELPSEPEQLFPLPRDGFRFMITGEPGSRWIVQASDDFQHWRQIAAVESGFETEFCDRGSRQHRARAYRVQAEFALPQFNRPELTRSNTLTNQPARCEPARRAHR